MNSKISVSFYGRYNDTFAPHSREYFDKENMKNIVEKKYPIGIFFQYIDGYLIPNSFDPKYDLCYCKYIFELETTKVYEIKATDKNGSLSVYQFNINYDDLIFLIKLKYNNIEVSKKENIIRFFGY